MQRISLLKHLRKVGLLKWMSKELPSPVIKKLYTQYVRPSLEYAAPLWHGSFPESDALQLERIQCSVARRLLRAPWSTPKEILLESIEWPSLRWQSEVLSLCLFLKLLNFRPEPLGDILFPFAKNRSTHSLRKPLQLLLPLAKSTSYVKSFFYRSALLWNSLPHSIQSLTSPPKFRMALENHWHLYQYKTDSNIPFPCT